MGQRCPGPYTHLHNLKTRLPPFQSMENRLGGIPASQHEANRYLPNLISVAGRHVGRALAIDKRTL